VQTLDENVGRLAEALDDLGIADNTIIVFTSDNGGNMAASYSPDLRGSKGQLYEGGIRVPTFVVSPKGAKAASVATPIVTLDFYPTLVEMAGLKLPDAAKLDGRSFGEAVRLGRGLSERPIYWHVPVYLESGRVFDGSPRQAPSIFRSRPNAAIRDGKWKLIINYEDNLLELYDLAVDQSEKRNLAAEQPVMASQLLSKLREWQRATNAPIPTQLNPAYNPEFKGNGKRMKREKRKRNRTAK
jgi:arylsulfatase A-like enzyme